MRTSRTLTFGFFLLLLTGAALIAAANVWKTNLVVETVVVSGNRVVETNEILQLSHVKQGTKMYDLDLMAIAKDVSSHYFLKNVVVERDLPSTVRISVEERTPVAMVNATDILYLDQDGVVLPHSISAELFDLPLITNISPGERLVVGATIRNPDVTEALTILSTAKLVNKELYHLISEVRLRNGGDLILYSAERGIPILFGRGQSADKLVRLETFWNEVVRERGAGSLQYIDLRYDDQIVVRWNEQTKAAGIL